MKDQAWQSFFVVLYFMSIHIFYISFIFYGSFIYTYPRRTQHKGGIRTHAARRYML
jgi:hypothetical protein